ncbi:MAG: hypothetical protein K9N46_11225 [Candidatus Marinimicrobia bacterium]|nr:hypothetical protein [Candidatus Neomarinimicrobiota bacterium]MCF7827646.1 hypothetical protein [Candidatus Neomarinimicrobiota bacterium]MCF7881299.1 hypothetical protein [Candidatus Neomarinimicrobiota bacterium]
MAAPLLAGLEMEAQACEMSCCMMANSETAEAGEESVMDDSCMEMNSCLPGDKKTPDSLEVNAEAPKTKVKAESLPEAAMTGLTKVVHQKTDQIRFRINTVVSGLFDSSREKLAEHSILII